MSTENDIEAMEDIDATFARILGRYQHLHKSRAALLAAAKRIVANDSHGASDWAVIDDLQAAIAAAEESAS